MPSNKVEIMKYCQDITEMMERTSVERLSISAKISSRFHLFICKTRKRYYEDSKAMDTLLTQRFNKIHQYSFSTLEKDALKNKI